LDDRLQFLSVAALDDTLARFIDHVHASQSPASWARNTFLGILSFNPHVGNRLPVSHDLCTRLAKVRPSVSPPPLTWDICNLIGLAMLLWRRGWERRALGLLVAFDCYLRVNELCKLTKEDVSVPHDFPRQGQVGLVIRSTKVGRAQAVHVRRESVALLLVEHVRRLPRGALVFNFSSSQFRTALRDMCQALKLPAFTPHSCRHGGASQDLREGQPVDWVQLRGRWASQVSARRYFQSVSSASLDTVRLVRHSNVGRRVTPTLQALLLLRLRRGDAR
jgi:integrase